MCEKSNNIHEIQLQEYCNILKKLKEAFVIHRFRIFHSYASSFNLFSNSMQINIQDDTDTWGYLHPLQHLYVFYSMSQPLTQGHESILVTSGIAYRLLCCTIPYNTPDTLSCLWLWWQVISGKGWHLRFPDVCLIVEKNLGKSFNQENWSDRGSNPVLLCVRQHCYPLITARLKSQRM